MMPSPTSREVIVGVDTHTESHTAVVIDLAGCQLDQLEIVTTLAGYRRLVDWACGHGVVRSFGVEGTGAYGAGLARFLAEQAIVVEVNRTNRQHRRRHGKSDPADALAAARAVLAGEATATAKDSSGLVEAVRVLHLARRSATKAKTQAGNQIKDLIVTAPEPIRDELRKLKTPARVRTAATWDTTDAVVDTATATRHAIASLARRWLELHREIKQLEQQIWPLLRQLVPTLLAERGVGLDVAAKLAIAAGENPDRLHNEASFAALCGTSPVEATSGQRQHRHRLNRGGNRQANNALHTVVLYRARHDTETRAYIERRRREQLSDREIWRCLKRALARRFHHLLVHDLTNPLT